MDITIENLNASKSVHDLNTLIWKSYSRKSINFFILFYSLGFMLFIVGMTVFSEYNKSTFMDTTTYNTNWHLTESFGFVIIIIATFILIRFLKNKAKYFKKVKETSERHLKGTNKITIQLNDNHVTYQSSNMSSEMKWSLFSSYTILNNYLLLYTDDNMLSCIWFDKNLTNLTDLNVLMDFVKKRLPYKDPV
jgi:hypothetical protein